MNRFIALVTVAVLLGGLVAGGFITYHEGYLDKWISGPVAGNTYTNCGSYRKLEFRGDGRVVMKFSSGSEIYEYEVINNSEVAIEIPLATLLIPVSSDGTLSVDSITSMGKMRTLSCSPEGGTGAGGSTPSVGSGGKHSGHVNQSIGIDSKVETTLNQVHYIYERVKSLYASQSSYRSLSGELIVSAGMAPKGTVRSGKMVNEWEGGISIEGSARFTDRFSIGLNSVPKDACVGILMSDGYERFDQYGLFSIATVPMDFVKRPSEKRAKEVCSTFNSMRFTFDGVERGR